MSARRPLQSWLDRADQLSAAGKYFEAHEELEAGWNAADGAEKVLLQGLIQLAAGLHRLTLDPARTDGAFYLLERGIEKLRTHRALLTPESAAALEAAIADVRGSGKAPASFRFGLKAANLES